jgi:hypothetical protein
MCVPRHLVARQASGNPKIMAAAQDVMQNGMGAMAKYQNDPDVMEVLKELQSLM